MTQKFVEFVRKRNYVWVKELGQGACGRTVLLHDNVIDEYFVCKKYSPFHDQHQRELFDNFVREIKLLHEVYHQNIVRVFNYHLYPDKLTGYIVMEYIEGQDVEEYLRGNPEKISDVFLQTIKGFAHLEAKDILHRDVRPTNIMISNDGTVKVIDLGFGKRIKQSIDFDKSISLNWWCETPAEFMSDTYDFRTEIYFVGKLFEKILQEGNIGHFRYKGLLGRMCQHNPSQRVSSFFDVEKEIQSNRFEEIRFFGQELNIYRAFANAMTEHVTKIENGTKYIDDLDKIKTQLDATYRRFMLEEDAPDAAPIFQCFLNGAYYYRKQGFPVSAVEGFLSLLKSSDEEKQRIILANLHSRLDSINRYNQSKLDELDDDIPF